jgi:hypothetical protein
MARNPVQFQKGLALPSSMLDTDVKMGAMRR